MKKKKKFRINKVIQVLILADLVLLGSMGFIDPIFAIFLNENIAPGAGGIQVAGFAWAVYWIAKALLIVPIGRFLDRFDGEKDDLYFIIIGSVLIAGAVFGYLYVTQAWQIYLLQLLLALGVAMNEPAYMAVFTRHIDKGKEAFEWGARSSIMGVGIGIGGALGGIVAKNFGFYFLFLAIGFVLIVSSVLPFLILSDVTKSKKTKKRKKPQTLWQRIIALGGFKEQI
jgi:MFS family permease